jgi:hypothetical protein
MSLASTPLRRIFPNIFGDAHTTGMRGLRTFGEKRFVVEFAGRLGIRETN